MTATRQHRIAEEQEPLITNQTYVATTIDGANNWHILLVGEPGQPFHQVLDAARDRLAGSDDLSTRMRLCLAIVTLPVAQQHYPTAWAQYLARQRHPGAIRQPAPEPLRRNTL